MFNDLLFRLRALFRRAEVDADLEDELRFHLEREEEKLRATGLTADDAHRRARIQLGGFTQVKEEVRESWKVGLLDSVGQDIRFGARLLRRNPGFFLAAVITLALAIGANSAIFSVVDAVLLRPLPYPEPDRLAAIMETKPSQALEWLYATNNNFLEWRRRATSFESMAASYPCSYRMSDATEVRMLPGACASASFFPILRVQPFLGQFWNSDADVVGRDHVAVLSYDTWQHDFGGDPSAIGKTIFRANDREPFAIVGVLPPDFQFCTDEVKVWTPLAIDPASPVTRFHIMTVTGRLKTGVSFAQANQEMSRIAAQLESEFPQSNTGWGITVGPVQRFYSTLGNTRTTLLVLLAAVGGLLLIACANIANLLLARATTRQKEIAVRAAIGATALRLFRQTLTESVLLGLIGGALGFVVGWLAFRPMMAMAPHIASFHPHALRIDLRVFAFSMAISMIAAVIFGVAPAMRTARQGFSSGLRQAGRGGHGAVRTTLARHSLVVTEIAVAVVLLTGTGLFIRTLHNLQRDQLGFNSSKLVTMQVCCLDTARYPGQVELNAFFQQAFDRVRSIPGVKAASATSALPMRLFDGGGSQISIRGFPPPATGREYLSDFRFVEPDYFSTMGIALLRGRLFTAADDEKHDTVAVINDRMAQRYWPNQDPIGQQFQLGAQPTRWWTIVGVVANSRDRGLGRETRNTFYLSDLQTSTVVVRGFNLLVRVQADSPELLNSIRQALRSTNNDLSIGQVHTFDDVLSDSLAPQRFSATLMTLFAAFALSLALIGVYGVTAYTVAQRRHEIGIRMALGARPADVMMLVVKQGARLAAFGVAFGAAGALATTRLVSNLLFGVSARDPLTISAVCILLAAVAVLACCIPARRAMRVQPVIALRSD